ncbi:MAG: hypothetical protein ABI619_05280 [Betaproteobacteria bacterium]
MIAKYLIAVALAALGFASAAPAQKDAAEKVREGSVEHWIEYYKAQQQKPPAASAPQPAGETGSGKHDEAEAPPREKTGQK